MPEDTYDEILEFAYALAEDAGKLILEGSAKRWRAHQEYEVKKNPVDLVTETDQAVEDFIKAAIVAKYPSHKFIGEESSEGKAKPVLTDEYTWIVDPIDGTMNPMVGCSIGVVHRSRPVVGVINQPFLNRIFSAAEGRGAFMNRTTPLPLTGGIPQPLTQLNQCLIAAEWGSERSADTMDKKINSFRKLNGDPDKGIDGGKFVHALRTTGATTCNLVCVAAGELDISWDAGCWAWDVAAAAVILKETGAFFHGGKELYARDAPIGEILMSRRYVAVRALPPTDTETSEQIQRRLATELYEAVEEWTTPSMKGY
ncbi:Protein qutG [Vanrija pseudolonga]|uniref:Inositol-1-monophosphatase n=2 Tax=Vanrija pseudolonga TaxID=143232 RepID=A0AAF0YAY0_9TREE|nr:Protein qutG [Vanrija pseudolonga]